MNKQPEKSKYNRETVKALVEAKREFLTSKETYCKVAGIKPYLYDKWLKDKPEFKLLMDEIEREINDNEMEYAKTKIFNKMDKDWKAASWWLERKFPEQFAAKNDKFNIELVDKKVVFQIGMNEPIEITEPIPIENKIETTIAEIPEVNYILDELENETDDEKKKRELKPIPCKNHARVKGVRRKTGPRKGEVSKPKKIPYKNKRAAYFGSYVRPSRIGHDFQVFDENCYPI